MSRTVQATSLPPMDVASRMARVRHRLRAEHLDALLVTRLPNIRYLSGFTGSAAVLVVDRESATFVTDGRYAQQAREQLENAGVACRIEIVPSSAEQRQVLTQIVAGYAALGLEAHGVTWAQQRAYSEWFGGGCELVPTEHLIEDLRRTKEPGEVARIRAACAIADDALAELMPTLAEGPTERSFALALERAMRERGASGVSFDPIVAAGPNGAKPHARPSERQIERGELVVIDFGCVVDGYCSDMTRTVSVGDPGAQARRVWQTVLESQEAGRAAVVAGVTCAAVDAASRSVIADAGWGDAFVHGTGHGVGLEIHEAPRVARTASDTLVVGDVVTVEPGIYLPGVGGVRIEDTLVVTEDGADALTCFPKYLSI